jgi:hypothetical protein
MTNMVTITNDSEKTVTLTFSNGEITISPKSKIEINGGTITETYKEPTPEPSKITCWEDAYRKIEPRYYIDSTSNIFQYQGLTKSIFENRNLLPTEKDCEESLKFIQRRLIAAACGAREFKLDEENFMIRYDNNKGEYGTDIYEWDSYEGVNYFDTKEQAEEYLQACLNSKLL